MKHLCVVGMGYIGLPTASLFATNGFMVTGVDVNRRVVDVINQGNIHIEEPGLKTVVQAAIHSGNLRAQTEPTQADVFILAVPTPITSDRSADMSFVRAAARAIIPYLQPGNLVILESTSPPGTCRDLLAPLFAEAGWEAGVNFHLAHCPERVLPGRILQELLENHRVVGGMTSVCSEKARALYGAIVSGQIHVTDATTAEMVKVMENTYRDVNIALANELAQIATGMRINAWDVIRLANLHPRVSIHQPGPGVGGHCISVDPWFIVEQAPETARLIRLARQTNDEMPHYVLEMVRNELQLGSKVAVLGVAYKGNVDDCRESPALEVIHLLHKSGYEVAIFDPHVHELEYALSTYEDAVRDADCLLLLTPHQEYLTIAPTEAAERMRRKLVIDTRNMLDRSMWQAAGFQLVHLGDGSNGRAIEGSNLVR